MAGFFSLEAEEWNHSSFIDILALIAENALSFVIIVDPQKYQADENNQILLLSLAVLIGVVYFLALAVRRQLLKRAAAFYKVSLAKHILYRHLFPAINLVGFMVGFWGMSLISYRRAPK